MPGKGSPSSQTRLAGVKACLVELAVEGVVDHRVAVDDLAGVGVDEDHVAHVALVRHLDGVGQDVGTGDASDGALAVDVQLRGGCLDARQVSRRVGRARRVLAHRGHGAVGGLSRGQPGGHAVLEVRGDEAVDRGELTGLVDLRVELAAEDGDALVGLGELDRPSVGGLAHVRLGELVGLSRRTRRRTCRGRHRPWRPRPARSSAEVPGIRSSFDRRNETSPVARVGGWRTPAPRPHRGSARRASRRAAAATGAAAEDDTSGAADSPAPSSARQRPCLRNFTRVSLRGEMFRRVGDRPSVRSAPRRRPIT